MTELTLFDSIPDDAPDVGHPATVFATPSTDHGHLLIETEMGDWMFVYTGSDTVRCYTPGWVCGVDLTAEQMRVIGDYCLRMAERMERR